MADFKSVKINSNNNTGDAFGRLRVSAPITIFDTQSQYNDFPLLSSYSVSGGGTMTHLPNEASVALSVGTASGDEVKSQTREYFRCTPGKSTLVTMSRVFNTPKANLRQRVGLFDDRNGLFFECNGLNFGVVKRSYTSGSVVDTRIEQANFNLDKLDGTGSSGKILDISKANIYIIDFQWLGAGRVRFGVDIDGIIIYCHELLYANNLSTAYMTTANLPFRDEITNIGATSSSSTLKSICSSVTVEDGEEEAAGLEFTANTGSTKTAVTTRRSILTIRPRATFNGLVNRAKVTDFEIEVTSDADALWEIVYNGTLGGTPSFTAVDSNYSTVEKDTAGTTVTGGQIIKSGYVSAGFKSTTGISSKIVSKYPFTLDINGSNPTNLSIVCTSLSGTANTSASISWKEIY